MFRLIYTSFNIRTIRVKNKLTVNTSRDVQTDTYRSLNINSCGFEKIKNIHDDYYGLEGYHFKHLNSDAQYYHFSSKSLDNYFGISFKSPRDDPLAQLINTIIFESLDFSPNNSNVNSIFRNNLTSEISTKFNLDHVSLCFATHDQASFYQNIKLLSQLIGNEEFLINSLNNLLAKKHNIIKHYLELRNDFNILLPYILPNYSSLGSNNYYNQFITLKNVRDYFNRYLNYSNSCICTMGNIYLENIITFLNTEILSKSTATHISVVSPYKNKAPKRRYIEVSGIPIIHPTDVYKSHFSCYQLPNDRTLLLSLNILNHILQYLPPYLFPLYMISNKHCRSPSNSNGVCRSTTVPLYLIGLQGSTFSTLEDLESTINNFLVKIRQQNYLESNIALQATENIQSGYLQSYTNRKIDFLHSVFNLWCHDCDVLDNIFIGSHYESIKKVIIKHPKIFEDIIQSALLNNEDQTYLSLEYQACDNYIIHDPIKNIANIIDNLHTEVSLTDSSSIETKLNTNISINSSKIDGTFVSKKDIKHIKTKIKSDVDLTLFISDEYPFTTLNIFISGMTLNETQSFQLKLLCMQRQLLSNKILSYADPSIYPIMKALNSLYITPSIMINSKESTYHGGVIISFSCNHSKIDETFSVIAKLIDKSNSAVMDPKFTVLGYMPELSNTSYFYSPKYLIPYSASSIHITEYMNNIYHGFSQCKFLVNFIQSMQKSPENHIKTIFETNKISCSVLTSNDYVKQIEDGFSSLFKFRQSTTQNEAPHKVFKPNTNHKALVFNTDIKIFVRSYFCPSEGEEERPNMIIISELLNLYFRTFKNTPTDWLLASLSYHTLNVFCQTNVLSEEQCTKDIDTAIYWINNSIFNKEEFVYAKLGGLRLYSKNYSFSEIAAYCLLSSQDSNQLYNSINTLHNTEMKNVVETSRKYLTTKYSYLYFGKEQTK